MWRQLFGSSSDKQHIGDKTNNLTLTSQLCLFWSLEKKIPSEVSTDLLLAQTELLQHIRSAPLAPQLGGILYCK